MEYKTGDRIFAKLSKWPFWPARIDKLPEYIKVPKGKYPVFFYGTHEVSFLTSKYIVPFAENKTKYGRSSRIEHFSDGMWEIEHQPCVLMLGKDNEAEEFLCESYNIVKPEPVDSSITGPKLRSIKKDMVDQYENDGDLDKPEETPAKETVVKRASNGVLKEEVRLVMDEEEEDDDDDLEADASYRPGYSGHHKTLTKKSASGRLVIVDPSAKVSTTTGVENCTSVAQADSTTTPISVWPVYSLETNKYNSLRVSALLNQGRCRVVLHRLTAHQIAKATRPHKTKARRPMFTINKIPVSTTTIILTDDDDDDARCDDDDLVETEPRLPNNQVGSSSRDHENTQDDDDDKCSSIIIRLAKPSSMTKKQGQCSIEWRQLSQKKNRIKVKPNNTEKNRDWLKSNTHQTQTVPSTAAGSTKSRKSGNRKGSQEFKQKTVDSVFKKLNLDTSFKIAKKAVKVTESVTEVIPIEDDDEEDKETDLWSAATRKPVIDLTSSVSKPDKTADGANKWYEEDEDGCDFTAGGADDDDDDEDFQWAKKDAAVDPAAVRQMADEVGAAEVVDLVADDGSGMHDLLRPDNNMLDELMQGGPPIKFKTEIELDDDDINPYQVLTKESDVEQPVIDDSNFYADEPDDADDNYQTSSAAQSGRGFSHVGRGVDEPPMKKQRHTGGWDEIRAVSSGSYREWRNYGCHMQETAPAPYEDKWLRDQGSRQRRGPSPPPLVPPAPPLVPASSWVDHIAGGTGTSVYGSSPVKQRGYQCRQGPPPRHRMQHVPPPMQQAPPSDYRRYYQHPQQQAAALPHFMAQYPDLPPWAAARMPFMIPPASPASPEASPVIVDPRRHRRRCPAPITIDLASESSRHRLPPCATDSPASPEPMGASIPYRLTPLSPPTSIPHSLLLMHRRGAIPDTPASPEPIQPDTPASPDTFTSLAETPASPDSHINGQTPTEYTSQIHEPILGVKNNVPSISTPASPDIVIDRQNSVLSISQTSSSTNLIPNSQVQCTSNIPASSVCGSIGGFSSNPIITDIIPRRPPVSSEPLSSHNFNTTPMSPEYPVSTDQLTPVYLQFESLPIRRPPVSPEVFQNLHNIQQNGKFSTKSPEYPISTDIEAINTLDTSQAAVPPQIVPTLVQSPQVCSDVFQSVARHLVLDFVPKSPEYHVRSDHIVSSNSPKLTTTADSDGPSISPDYNATVLANQTPPQCTNALVQELLKTTEHVSNVSLEYTPETPIILISPRVLSKSPEFNVASEANMPIDNTLTSKNSVVPEVLPSISELVSNNTVDSQNLPKSPEFISEVALKSGENDFMLGLDTVADIVDSSSNEAELQFVDVPDFTDKL